MSEIQKIQKNNRVGETTLVRISLEELKDLGKNPYAARGVAYEMLMEHIKDGTAKILNS